MTVDVLINYAQTRGAYEFRVTLKQGGKEFLVSKDYKESTLRNYKSTYGSAEDYLAKRFAQLLRRQARA